MQSTYCTIHGVCTDDFPPLDAKNCCVINGMSMNKWKEKKLAPSSLGKDKSIYKNLFLLTMYYQDKSVHPKWKSISVRRGPQLSKTIDLGNFY